MPGQQEVSTLLSLFDQRRYIEAEFLARSMTENFPHDGFGWNVLGVVFNQMGRSADALAPMQRAITLSPNDAMTHYNLGITFHNLGRLDEAAASYRRALAIKPDYVEAHNNLGNTLKDMGRLNKAVASYRRALQSNPDYAEAYCNVGNTLKELGLLDEAETNYRQALQIKPDFVGALNNLALLLNARGDSAMAVNIINHSLQFKETAEAKSIFVACLKRLHFTHDDSEIRAIMVRALTETWGRTSEMVRASTDLVKLNPDIGACVARAADAWPQRLSAQDLFGPNGLAALSADTLLCALLDLEPICDIEIEHFLTMARRALLETAIGVVASADESSAASSFYSALARQCFINEYVFSYTDDEIQKASDLRDSLVDALEANDPVPAPWPIAVAAYFPLCSLPFATQLLERQWPEEVTSVLGQQICEPAEEMQLRTTIPRLTDIEDEVSLLVQNQYEANPYPRWIKADPAAKAKNIIGFLCQKFPLASLKRHAKNDDIDILVAGCGTGQHSIGTAQRIQNARVLAVDLSISSLSYAKRKTRELGLTSIEYAQADLLKLGSLGRSFDVIESVGVLHHLADPWAGWRVLLSLLRPGGFMELGFYSEIARRNVVRIRDFIVVEGYDASASGIRQFRQDLIDSDNSADFGAATKSTDFYSISSCRDLFFHVQEHHMTLTGIEAFLQENNLTFLGFEIDADTLHAYKRRFPDDRAATDLGQWRVFENENPDTFFGMYQFWIQKAS
jgi:tetratricopeptide (TPR) repeat protein/SAM-dependent methyltransferase